MRGLRGNDPPELPVLSPDEALIRRNGAAWYDPALVELIRHGCAGDPLIEQIAIVLKSDLVEERALGNLYGEALANALAAQLLRRNYSPRANDLASKGGLGGRRLKLTLDYLEANLHSNLRIHELARRVGLSPNYFCSAFERSIGMPPHRWVLQRRIERAKNMLAERKTRLVEIADVLGFADQSHFSRLFRRFTGITPGRFRASL
jgi:AraC family transcriptional regulator